LKIVTLLFCSLALIWGAAKRKIVSPPQWVWDKISLVSQNAHKLGGLRICDTPIGVEGRHFEQRAGRAAPLVAPKLQRRRTRAAPANARTALLIRRPVFGGRGTFLIPSVAFSCLKSISYAIPRLGLSDRNVAGCCTPVVPNVAP
jgi:hypothetical protein